MSNGRSHYRRLHYTQSKVMAWLAFDRAVALANHFGLAGPVPRWEQVRARICPYVPNTVVTSLSESLVN